MKKMKKWLLNEYPITPPIFIGIFFTLSLLSRNVDKVSTFESLLPMAMISGFTSCLYLILRYFLKSRKKAGIISLLIIVIFFSYGYLQIGLLYINFGNVYFGITAISATLLFLFIRLKSFTMIASIISICLVIVPSATIVAYHLNNPNTGTILNSPCKVEIDWENIQEKPDIYYIIVDRYASAEIYESLGYDNSEFINLLSNKGFYVVPDGHSNYSKTSLSLASSLNMDYINTQALTNTKAPWQLLKDNKVKDILQSGDYTFISVGSWIRTQTYRNEYADINYVYNSAYKDRIFTTGFFLMFYKTTILSSIFPITEYSREYMCKTTIYQFDTLETIPSKDEPTFTFAHIVCPHDPFVFDQDGNYLTEDEVSEKSRIEKNFNQVLFINKRLEQLINKILNESKVPPIIVIQSDEGVYTDEFNDYLLSESEEYKQRLGILNAYYLPFEGAGALYESITPVNTFRVIFNEYFGTNLELLPDKSYFIRWLEYPLISVDATSELQEEETK